jgi:hypothetical protein
MGKSRKTKHPTRAGKKEAPYKVFVSHATADKWLATTLCEKIEEQTGAETFRDDRDIGGGDDIPEVIRREIARSNEMLVLLTPESVGRPWVLFEVGAAWGRRRDSRIVALLCHVKIDTIPDMIASKKAMSLNEFDQYLKDLGKRARRHGS